MFAYCDNNPVNKVDKTGKWGYDVHLGRNGDFAQALKLQGPISNYNGIDFGTETWARQIGFSPENIKSIAFGDWHLADGVIRFAGYATIVYINWAQSWHGNMNNYKSLNMLLPDTRELRSYETLVCLTETSNLFETAQCLTDGALARESVRLAMWELGIALHPAQDKDGHHDYWAPPTFTISGLIWAGKEYGTDGDDVGLTYPLNGVTYYHWDDLIRSRDATYNILGRFYRKYEGVIKMR